jgi:hypothetical protein
MTLKSPHLLLVILTAICVRTYGQTSLHRSGDSSLHLALLHYHKSLNDQKGIYNGSLYLRLIQTHTGHVYFKSDSLTAGQVVYDGVLYENVPLLYDELKDELVTTDITGLSLVQLIKDKVTSFTIYSSAFIHQFTGTDSQGFKSNGFFRLLYDGKMKVLHRETKFLRQKIVRENEYNRYVDTQSGYWISSETGLQRISNYRDLLNVFGNTKKQVHEHIRSKGIKFREETEQTLVEAVSFYENARIK